MSLCLSHTLRLVDKTRRCTDQLGRSVLEGYSGGKARTVGEYGKAEGKFQGLVNVGKQCSASFLLGLRADL